MDSSLLTLFTTEEILRRLAAKESTGALHVFTSKESANIFLRGGVIVGAAKGLMEGEEVLKQAIDWADAKLVWQVDQQPLPNLKPLELDVTEFLQRAKAAPKLEIGGKTISETPKTADEAKSVLINIPSRAATTGRIHTDLKKDEAPVPPTPPAPPTPRSPLTETAPTLTATKSIAPSSQSKITFEESLLRKFKLVLIAAEGEPERRLRIVRLNNLVGRNPACDFTLDHGSVSRQHCLLQITERGLHAKDLGTTNGTKVNGIACADGYINLGDKLTIGHLSFILEKDETEEAVEA